MRTTSTTTLTTGRAASTRRPSTWTARSSRTEPPGAPLARPAGGNGILTPWPITLTLLSWAPVPVGMSRRSARASWARRWPSSRRSTGAGSASTSGASRPRRC
ncbi:hypothetical protein [Ornithinimicrobium kibberense]|uniref:hypothetical protein n=1 Tax=Ornithinimicrobium kibberense TaxID=282060 RepID=UPI003611DCDB